MIKEGRIIKNISNRYTVFVDGEAVCAVAMGNHI